MLMAATAKIAGRLREVRPVGMVTSKTHASEVVIGMIIQEAISTCRGCDVNFFSRN